VGLSGSVSIQELNHNTSNAPNVGCGSIDASDIGMLPVKAIPTLCELLLEELSKSDSR
jgi:hypothetical protein